MICESSTCHLVYKIPQVKFHVKFRSIARDLTCSAQQHSLSKQDRVTTSKDAFMNFMCENSFAEYLYRSCWHPSVVYTLGCQTLSTFVCKRIFLQGLSYIYIYVYIYNASSVSKVKICIVWILAL